MRFIVTVGTRETPEWPSESFHTMEDHQDSAAQQAVQKAHAVHHADGDYPGGVARSDDSVPAAEARFWNQGSGVFTCDNVCGKAWAGTGGGGV